MALSAIRGLVNTARKRFWLIVIVTGVLAVISALWEGIKVKMGW